MSKFTKPIPGRGDSKPSDTGRPSTPDRETQNRLNPGRRDVLKTISLLGVAWAGSATAVASSTFPDTIPLPTGFRPEGIVTGRGTTFFVGSLANGAIYRGDLRTGEGEVLFSGAEGRVAVGLSHDDRSNNLFVAGDGTGMGYVHDGETGEELEAYALTAPGSFVNDVLVTSSAAYFTDSFRPFIYKVPLGPAGSLPDPDDVEEIELGGEFTHVPGQFNANGIDAPPSAEYLIVVNSFTGLLFKVDPASGEASEIDTGGADLTAGDGILLDGRALYVLRNRFNEIVVVRLGSEALTGDVMGTITDADFDVPATIAEFGSHLYAVNARFGISEPGEADYDVIRVSKHQTS